MKTWIVGGLLILSQAAFAGTFLEMKPTSEQADDLARFRFTPEIRRAMEAEALKFEAQKYSKSSQETIPGIPERFVIFHSEAIVKRKPKDLQNPNEVRVFGFTQKDVLHADGDPQGDACGKKHEQGDFSNRWCHAYFTNQMNAFLKNQGLGNAWSAILSSTFFLPKEYLYDQKPSASDLMSGEYEFYNHEKNQATTRMTVTVFGDKMFFLTFQKQFWGF